MNTQPPLKNTLDVEIGERVSEALIIKRVPAKSLASDLGISYSSIRRTLAGERAFTFWQLAQIAERLNIQPSSLLPDSFAARDVA